MSERTLAGWYVLHYKFSLFRCWLSVIKHSTIQVSIWVGTPVEKPNKIMSASAGWVNNTTNSVYIILFAYIPDPHHAWYKVVWPILKGILFKCWTYLLIIAEPNGRNVAVIEAKNIAIFFPALSQFLHRCQKQRSERDPKVSHERKALGYKTNIQKCIVKEC